MSPSPFTSVAMGVCALLSGGLVAFPPSGSNPLFSRTGQDWQSTVATSFDSNAKNVGGFDEVRANHSIGAGGEDHRNSSVFVYFSTWREWGAREWSVNMSKLIFLLTPILILFWFGYRVKPPVTKGNVYVCVMSGNSLPLSNVEEVVYCVGSLGGVQQRTRDVQGVANPVWNNPDDGDWWCFSGVDVADPQQGLLTLAVFDGTGKLGEAKTNVIDAAWLEGDDLQKTVKLPRRSCAGATVEVKVRFEPAMDGAMPKPA